MALTKAEQKELDDLRARATTAEKALGQATVENADLVTANDEANVKIAEAEIVKQDAITEAVEAREAELLEQSQSLGKKNDKSFSPKTPTKFDRGAYFAECHGSDAAFAQNGWFYDAGGKPLRPTRPAKKAA